MDRGGSGVISFAQIVTGSKLRELNVMLNNTKCKASSALRSRHYAQKNTNGIDYNNKDCTLIGIEESKRENDGSCNINKHYQGLNIVSPLLGTNTSWLAKYGFYLRESNELFTTAVLEDIMHGVLQQQTVALGQHIGRHQFKLEMATHSLAEGNKKLLKYNSYGTIYHYLHQIITRLINYKESNSHTTTNMTIANKRVIVSVAKPKGLPKQINAKAIQKSIINAQQDLIASTQMT